MSASGATKEQLLDLLEDGVKKLQKTHINIKKCPKARLTKSYVEARITIVEEHWRSFQSAHQELLKVTSKEERALMSYFKNDEFFTCEELYVVLRGELRDIIGVSTESAQEEKSSCHSHCSGNNNTVHLPRIHLPSFDGKYEDWTTFKDLFLTLVHENKALNEVQKLHYLKTSVTGEAGGLLKHIQVSSSNYSTAWETLNSRYGNKRLIINNIMKRLFNQKKMTAQSASQLRSLLDTSMECLNSLQNLEISTSSWDILIIYLLVQKLDPETHKAWEDHVHRDEIDKIPTWSELKMFLESTFRTLELVSANTHTSRETKVKERSFHVATPTTEKKCIMCTENHTLCHCKEFIKMEPKERSEYVKTNHLCFNCLAPGHSVFKCKLQMSCRICKRRHHSLLHENKSTEPAATMSNNLQPLVSQHVTEEEEEVQVNTMIAPNPTARQGVALLATAVVEATNEQGYTVPLRVLIDQGSQATFISEKAAQLLKLKRQSIRGTVVGVGSSRTDIKHVAQLNIRSRWDKNYSLSIQAYVMTKQLTTKIPSKTINAQPWPHINGLDLADPSYLTPGSIDLLLGIKEYVQIMHPDIIKGPPGTPCAQKTNLGWILFGEINTNHNENIVVMHHQIDFDDMLKSIWEVDTDNDRHLTKDEKKCEDIYNQTTMRNKDGRYIVKLPFKTDSPQSTDGNSKEIATQRYLQLERRFRKSPDLKSEYTKVINNYITQGYMEMIPDKERDIKGTVYLPHHAVIRTDKETSRTRVVFDASCKNTNNTSLNDELLVGPQLQEDIRNLIMRWRMKRICFMADIQQMYLQILVATEDTDFQRILWRPDTDLQEYRLLRVTFGTATAPYLAVKTLHRVADDEGSGKSLATQSIKHNFYMDDWLDGADEIETAISLATDVTNILKKGGFQLTKFASNNMEFMKSIDEDKRSAKANVNMNLDGTVKALGIVWNLNKDIFQYNLSLPTTKTGMTKRSILSDIQKLFDPLGWISPSTVLAKMLMQKLWLEKVSWDENVSETVQEEWKRIKSDFTNVNDIQVERWLGTTNLNKDKTQIHGFSDSSMNAYAAAVYIRTVTADNKIQTNLIAAKTRVAPLKTISLPRLELCGALLLAKLMKQVSRAMQIPTSEMYAWTDSSIVLAWLTGEPNRWKLFVANRVVEILEILHAKQWFHVKSGDNPADLATRGMLLSELKNCDLWWKGPSWLSETEIKINHTEIMTTDIEQKTIKINTYLNTDEDVPKESFTAKFEIFDNLPELLKTITHCKRFLTWKKNKTTMESITTDELENSLKLCIKKVQEEEFKEEIERLHLNKPVKKKSPLRFLNPYLDEEQILRVGGRLKHTKLSEDKKHPIILGNKNALTSLIIADAHKRTLHGGVQLMLCYLLSKFWILRVKSMVKQYIHKCLICARLRAITKTQIMGHLPEARVTPSRPFLNSGVDFAGPFNVLKTKGRGSKTSKAYISIFVCMSTKATHLELVGDLTSEAFIGAFKRFVARRGKCNHMWSDQGRNFVGANKELQDAWKEVSFQFTGEIAQSLATEGTQWHFIPAYSPSFGGLWEAGVHSMKNHLKRILTTHLTYEEMTTILCQVEACLNSRPLCPLDDTDPDSTNPLTPGHFLIGEAPIVVPSPDLKDVRVSNLSRWQHTQKLLNDFWRRWQDEYLSRLQQRPKWLKKEEEFNIGDVVLIKTDNLPPGKWALGRIVHKHPGTDGMTRVYSVKSGSAITKRLVTKLCALPIDTT